MRLVLQRVSRAAVRIKGETVGQIGAGLCVLVGAGAEDTEEDVDYCVTKSVHMRIFPDDDDKMNRSLLDIQGGLLAISQFTLLGDARKGRRPSFISAMEPTRANLLYESYVRKTSEAGVGTVEKGVFGADMEIELVNDGPVTILLDSKRMF